MERKISEMVEIITKKKRKLMKSNTLDFIKNFIRFDIMLPIHTMSYI